MGRWLAKFLPEMVGALTDIPDTMTSVSALSGSDLDKSCQVKTTIKDLFQERAAIREFDGGQERIEAELGALDEVLPYLRNGNELHIPFNSPKKYRWWQGGQSIEETLRELGASEETIKCYVWDQLSGPPKPEGAEYL